MSNRDQQPTPPSPPARHPVGSPFERSAEPSEPQRGLEEGIRRSAGSAEDTVDDRFAGRERIIAPEGFVMAGDFRLGTEDDAHHGHHHGWGGAVSEPSDLTVAPARGDRWSGRPDDYLGSDEREPVTESPGLDKAASTTAAAPLDKTVSAKSKRSRGTPA